MDESQESQFYCGLSSGSVNTIQLIFQIQGLVGKNYFIFNSKSFQNDIVKLVQKKRGKMFLMLLCKCEFKTNEP